jgi:hypothetical protein
VNRYLAAVGLGVLASPFLLVAWRRSTTRRPARDYEVFIEDGPWPGNPALDSLKELQADGSRAMRDFTELERRLWPDEIGGIPAPQGTTYDEIHEGGARAVRAWLVQVGQEVERLMGHKAVLGMRYQLATAAPIDVEPFVRTDYSALWKDGWQQLRWVEGVVAKGSKEPEMVNT